MKQVPLDILRKYEYGDFYVDICVCKEENELGAWLYRKGYGIKLFMFGVDFKNTDLDVFVEVVEDHLDGYIEVYENEYI